jgi:predicted metalloprotease with PDZ domain
MKVASSGVVKAVSWEGPAFRAGIGIGSRIDTVNGQSFTPQALMAAIEGANTRPLKLGVVQDGKAAIVPIAYQGRLACPHLQPIAAAPDRLLPWLAKTRGVGAN